MTGLYVASQAQSLSAQHQLQRNMGDLSNILLRLSTGLRINSGKDDPAGLIASELLKSDITATNKAITNTQRANSVISIADSSLGQVSSLLNDIKALVVEAANSGAMNAEQIKANQLQVDASLDSIDRISKTTNYQGKLLLDGSMDFQTVGLDNSAVKDLKVHQANFGTMSQIDIGIDIQENSATAKLYYDKGGISREAVIEVGGNLGSDVFRFQAGTSVTDIANAINKVSDSTGVKAVVGSDATHGQIMITSAGFDNDLNLTALLAGSAGGNYSVKFVAGDSNETTYKITPPSNGQAGIIEFHLKMQPKTAPSNSRIDESFNGIYTSDITGDATGAGIVVQTSNGNFIRETEFVQYTGSQSPAVSATFDKNTGKLQIHYNASATSADLEIAINSIKGFKLLQGTAADLTGKTGTITSADLRANNALDFTSNINGTKFENTDIVYFKGTESKDVELEYKANAQQAAATIRWGNGTPAAGDVQLRISGKEAGSGLNDVTIEFEQDDNFDPGDVSAVYDAERKILHIRGQIDNQTDATKNASFGTLKAAIEAASPFKADITEYNTATQKYDIAHALSNKIEGGLVAGGLDPSYTTTANITDNSFIKTGQQYGDIGTDNQALFIRVKDDTITANDVAAAFNDPANAAIAANFSVKPSIDNNGNGTIFSADWDTNVNARVFKAALTGGSSGLTTNVTARELVDFINNDCVLNQLFQADVALGQFGSGYLTLFDEAAYYGEPDAETALQFLGPAGSPDILFVTDGPNSPLYITYEPALSSSTSGLVAGLLPTNPNAALSVTALKAGEEYNNMAVRLIRLDNNHTADDSYVQYKAGPSNAMAYCSISESGSGTAAEVGKFIVYGKNGGTELNNVSVVAKLDKNQTERVKAVYDENTKQLIITVNSDEASGAGAVTLTEAVAAINAGTPFYAEYDYSFNQETGNTGPGSATFGTVFAAAPTVEIGNTGNTGGYNGVLEVYVGGDDTEITAQHVIDAINNDDIFRNLFAAQTIGAGSAAGTGIINFRADNLRKITDGSGKTVTEMNMVTGLIGGNNCDTSVSNNEGRMIIHLATDQYGNPITTAKDLVDFMNSLTAEETHGISVSLVRPAGLDNNLRTWTVDSCGNVIETQACDDGYGKGILKPTVEIDDCGNVTYFPIEFYSYGQNLTNGYASGSIVAVNGVDASLKIRATNAGPEYNNVGFRYILLTDPNEAMYTEFNGKEIIAYIHDGITAADVKGLIENSKATKGLFAADLVGTGTGLVTVADDYLALKGGLYDAGYRGGAKMLGAADADPHRLIFESAQEGSSQRVFVRTISGDFYVHNEAGKTADTAYGKDMVATLNGIKMKADGRSLSLDSSTLKIETVLDDKVKGGDSVRFSLTGGGATFQIGPDVMTNQQIRVGIGSMNTAKLGGASGRLFQLRSGQTADLFTDTKLADRIVGEAILSVATLRGRLGAIQRSTLDPAINSLQDSLEALTSAEAQISNADFAEESSSLTRAQILVQAGSKTLQIANQFPQYAAMLVGG